MSTKHGLDAEGAVVCTASPREDGSNVTSDPDEVTCVDCRAEMKWFINEEGNVYDYYVTRQAIEFPNDFHTAYETQDEAELAAAHLTEDEAKPDPDRDLPPGYRWATADECEDWTTTPGIIAVARSTDNEGKPYTDGEADLAVPILDIPDAVPALPMMTYDEAISYAIFAINTLQHPDASEDKDVEQLFEYADVTLTTLVDLRETVRGLPRATL